ARGQGGAGFSKVLLTNLSNTTASFYVGSVCSLFVGDNGGAAERWGIFALITLETLAWLTVVASLLALPRTRRCEERHAIWMHGVPGALFPGCGNPLIDHGQTTPGRVKQPLPRLDAR
ncbi:LysE family transporter, partial [Salmonella enterica]|uniref:LysE family transporter n=1 Tax=Salmonella enterica TaxID=28901 RepID=UPI00398C51EE